MSRAPNVTFLEPVPTAFCIEGGGTHTKATLFTDLESDPQIFNSGTCNPTTNFELSVLSVREVWKQVQHAGAPPASEIRLVLGCAGLAPDNIRADFVKEFADFAEAVPISDGYASMVGCGKGNACGMIVAGTGCAGHRMRSDGTSFQRDGWGWVGGDRGSGAWIGQRAIRHSLSVRDGLKPHDQLSDLILPQLGEDDAKIAGWFYDFEPSDIAKFSREVLRCAEGGHAFSEQLLQGAAAELRLLFESLGCPDDEPLYMSGSICKLLAERISAPMANKPTFMSGMALLGSAYVAFGKAPLEWPDQPSI